MEYANFLHYSFRSIYPIEMKFLTPVAHRSSCSDKSTKADSDRAAGDKLRFSAEWYDRHGCRFRQFDMTYYDSDSSVELYEPANRRLFLKRTPVTSFSVADLWLGNRVNVLGRHLDLMRYGSEKTAQIIGRMTQRTFAMIKPDGIQHMADILRAINSAGLRLVEARMAQLTDTNARFFYAEHSDRTFFGALVEYVCSGPVLGMQLMANDAVSRWRTLIGPTDSERARQNAPDSMRARFGTDATLNAVHGSDGEESAQREISWFFSSTDLLTPPLARSIDMFNSSTCVLLLPHAVREGQLPELLQLVASDGRFEVRALRTVRLDEKQARRFLRVYDGVLPEFAGLAQQLSSGDAVAIQLTSPLLADSTVETVRQLAGPRDPAVATLVRPGSLRAVLGVDRLQNGVHCTDLPEDASSELLFFFGDSHREV